jgi:hypothetical protein
MASMSKASAREVVRAVVEGRRTVEDAAAELDVAEAEVDRWVESARFVRELAGEAIATRIRDLEVREAALAQRETAERARLRDRRWARIATAGLFASVLAGVAFVASPAWAEVCSGARNQPGILNAFCPGSAARAGEVNHNFQTIEAWITSKIGDPNAAGVSTSQVTVAGEVSANSLSVSGDASVAGSLGTDGNLSVDGTARVGGLTVTGNLTANGNTWGSQRRTDSVQPFLDCDATPREYKCASGEFVCGLTFDQYCGTQWYEQWVQLVCCKL